MFELSVILLHPVLSSHFYHIISSSVYKFITFDNVSFNLPNSISPSPLTHLTLVDFQCKFSQATTISL